MDGSPASRCFAFFALAVGLLTLTSCSTIVGNVKPVDEKSHDYGVLDLAKENAAVWRKLDDSQLMPADAQISSNTEAFSSEITDLAFQSKKTAAIISLNSSCRKGRGQVADLRPFLHELLLGMSDVTEREEIPTQVSGFAALESRIAGKMAGEATRIRALVVSKEDCIYDLMYISRPSRFSVHEPDFNRFISSLRLR